jgi:UDP-glucose 4-epimerase
MTRRVLVTGAGGFIGQHVARLLAAGGAEVLATFRSANSLRNAETSHLSRAIAGELTHDLLTGFAEQADEIYHCAGSGSVALSMQDPDCDFNSNVLTTKCILEFSRQNGGIPVVLPSSAGVYGNVGQLPIRVAAVCQPISPYGTNKLISEMMARQYARSFEVPVAIVRLFSVYGPGLQKQLLWDASCKLMAGKMAFFGTGEESRDWINVHDAAALLVKSSSIAASKAPTMNGGTGTAIRIRTIIEGLAARLGIDGDIEFNGSVREGDPQHFQADVTEAFATGWRPRVNLEEGLTAYVEWFRASHRATKNSVPA